MKEFARHQSARRGRSFYGAEKLDLARPGPAHTRLASGPDGWREAVREQFSRVGIYGHSGGGFASARAILTLSGLL